MAARFEYRQAQEIAAAFRRYLVRYLFIGKSGAILLGYPDTTQDADLFLEKSPENGRAVVTALVEFEFPLSGEPRRSSAARTSYSCARALSISTWYSRPMGSKASKKRTAGG